MKFLLILSALLAVAVRVTENNPNMNKILPDTYDLYCSPDIVENCNSLFSNFGHVERLLQLYANQLISKSYEYLLIGSNFAAYTKERPGFVRLFRQLSDEAWEKAIDMIQYITKRGGEMKFDLDGATKQLATVPAFEKNELQALSYALDLEKALSVEAHGIHRKISNAHSHTEYDPAVAHFLDEKFIEPQTEVIRKLAGYVNDLKHLFENSKEGPVSVYLFDEYLQNH